ncbi:MAG: efflux RND transporter periplasmic adaptor subunit [Acidobacteriota bacterium]
MSHRARWRLTAFVGGSLLVLLTATSLFLNRNGNASPHQDPSVETAAEPDAHRVPVEVLEARQGSISRVLTSSATVEAEQSAQVLAKVEGMVTAVKVREGDLVRGGQVLALLEEGEKKLALERARLKLGKAEAEYNRAKLSVERQLISRYDFEKALFDRDLAASELMTAELELTYTQVRAPFAGRVTEKLVIAGKTVKKGDHLFSLADFDSLIARLFLPERDVFQLKVGQRVELGLESLAQAKFEGRIGAISPVVDPKTGTVKVTVDVTDPSASLGSGIRPGAFVRVQIMTDTHEDAVLVPKLALVREDGENFVYLAVMGKAIKRPVRLGYTSNGEVEVVEGVRAGDQVVVAGQTSLREHAAVEILN